MVVSNRTILIVDDDPNLSDNLSDILCEEGYRIFCAPNCAEGRALASQHKPAVALIDLKLPDGSGSSLLADIRRVLPDCLCVILTAFADVDSAVTAIEQGAYRYLHKPVRPRDLLSLLDTAFDIIQLREQRRAAEELVRARNVELEQVNTRLRKLVESAQRLTRCQDMRSLGLTLLAELSLALETSCGTVFENGADGLQLIQVPKPGDGISSTHVVARPGGVLDRAIRECGLVIDTDVEAESSVFPPSWREAGVAMLLAIPVLDEAGEVALLCLFRVPCAQLAPLDREVVQMLSSYASERLRGIRSLASLRASEARFRSLSENAPDVILAIDRDGDIGYVNAAWERMLGFSTLDTMGQSLRAFLEVESDTETASFWQKILRQDPESSQRNVRFRDQKGRSHFCDVSVALHRDMRGHVIGFVGLIKDMTEQRRMEAHMLHAQRMEAVGTLASGISHDLNNHLQIVGGQTDLLLVRKAEDDPDREYLQSIRKAVDTSSQVIKQLLTFGQKVESNRQPVDVNQKIRDLVRLLRRVLPRSIDMTVDLQDDLSTVHADPVQLDQILMNLVINARDAMPDGGKLSFQTRMGNVGDAICNTCFEKHSGPHVLIEVADTGVGMTPDVLDRIFEPFFTTKGVGQGSGLGLSMVYGLTRNHGGHIECRSAPLQGATFLIYLPLHSPAEAQAEQLAVDSKPAMTAAGRILLVDDEEVLLRIGTDLLRQVGFEVMSARSGEQAVAIVRERKDKIDLVILDLGMPGMGGLACLRAILETDPQAKVIVASGYITAEARAKAMSQGASEFVTKPYRLEDMLKKVRWLLAKDVPAREAEAD